MKHLLIVSGQAADLQDTIFGRQFTELESGIKKLGVAYTILRLSMFNVNYFGFKDTIKGANAIYAPADPTNPFTTVAMADAAKASAAVLVNPAK